MLVYFLKPPPLPLFDVTHPPSFPCTVVAPPHPLSSRCFPLPLHICRLPLSQSPSPSPSQFQERTYLSYFTIVMGADDSDQRTKTRQR